MLQYANVTMLLYMYVLWGRMLGVCMYAYIYVLRCIFMQGGMHEYVGMYT